MSTRKKTGAYKTTVIRTLVGKSLSSDSDAIRVAGSRQLKIKEVSDKFLSLSKDMEAGMPVSIKIIAFAKTNTIRSLYVIPGPTISLCKFLLAKSGKVADVSLSQIDVNILEKISDLRIKYNCVNTTDKIKVVRSLISTLKTAKISVQNADKYLKVDNIEINSTKELN